MQPVFLNLAANSFTSKYKYNMHKATECPHITSSNRGERGFVARFTFSSYTHMRVKITLFQINLHHYENVSVNHLKFK